MIEDKTKKKIIIGSVVAIVVLLVLVLGATYAFFSLDVINSETETNVNVNTGKLNNVAIKGTENNTLHIKVDAEDMKESLKGTSYYATTDDNKNYLKEEDPHIINIANLEVEGEMNPTNICTAKLKVQISGNLKDVLQSEDTLLHIEGGRSKHDIDLSLLLEEYPIEFVVDKSGTQKINAYLRLTNRDADQTYLAGKTLSVTLTIEGLTCKVQNSNDAVEKILANSEQLEAAEDVSLRGDVIRRFQGDKDKVQNNYICFGTSDSEICKGDTDHYMYRIIGVATNNDETTNTEYGQLKLIKKETLSDTMQWDLTADDDVKWPSSIVYKNIIADAYLQNKNYVPDEWNDKIANHNWLYGDFDQDESQYYIYQVGREVFKIEAAKKTGCYYVYNSNGTYSKKVYDTSGSKYRGETLRYDYITDEYWNSKLNSKVGIMYLSDFLIATNPEIVCADGNLLCKQSWIHMSNNDSNPSDNGEWTMTRMGWSPSFGNYIGIFIGGSAGGVAHLGLNYSFLVRPVIYLTSGIELSGAGTSSDPYIIMNVED